MKAYKEAKATARKACEEATAPALKAYDRAVATALLMAEVLRFIHRRCLRCGYEWNQKSERPSRQCPKCRSTAWNVRQE